ncbi:related to manganese resistance protein [Phialocephala subalpina]|uniref:Related to manganese resistance protein n=1 Tax=Phialocephala subalpina TaxID=576137 RepID=A0A1L7XQ14_9HELO|nr:related to manganese resistance protein [Phialocephala subalpina]
MKKSSPDSESFTDRIRSWARTKAHGPSPLSKDSSRSTTLPLSNSPSTNTQQNRTTNTHDDTTNVPPFPSSDLNGVARQPSKPTANNVADNTSTDHPPPAPPPQVEGEGTIIEDEKPKKNVGVRFWFTTKDILFSSPINILLVFVPVGIASYAVGLSPGIIFGMNAIAIIPLAGLLSHATESVAKRMGDTVGALMNVTFGNAVELIIFSIALAKGEIRIVQASLLGSILANLLLILGMCFLIGGLRFREQIYNSTVTQMSACLLSLSVMSLLLPTAFHASFNTLQADKATNAVLKVSRGTSVILLLVYGMYLLFQLKSHAYMYESTPQHIIDEESAPGPVAQWMDSSSDDSSSSSSSDSDASSGSNTTAKRIRRVMRGGRRRRKSSLGSKETADIEKFRASRTPSFGNSSIAPHGDGFFDEPQPMGHRLGAIDIAEDGDDEDPRRSRKSSISNHMTKKERRKEKERKRKEKKQRKKARRNGDNTITEGVADNGILFEKQVEDDGAPRRVDFAVATAEMGNESQTDTSQKRRFNIASMRPAIPKTLSQNVFTTPAPGQAPPSGPIPHVRYGIRRTNSLPDRLNEQPVPTPSNLRITPTRVGSLATGAAKNEKDDDQNISRTTAVVLLLVSTGLVAVCAEFMVDSINAVVSGNSALSETFIGLIILPIVGNAAEHVTAVTVAAKNKMDLAIGVAVGSSIQIALFVTPFVVLLGWAMGKEMSLYFTLFETVSLFVSAFIVNFLVLDGRSNYLEGALLCAAYVIIAVAAFFYPAVGDQSNLGGNEDAAKMMVRAVLGNAL